MAKTSQVSVMIANATSNDWCSQDEREVMTESFQAISEVQKPAHNK